MKQAFVKTFGCQMNVHDSRRIEEVLRTEGWSITDRPGGADLVVFNTCSVREKAEHKLRSAVGSLRDLKREHPDMVVAVAGCMAQEHGESLLKQLDLVDVLVGPDNIPDLPSLVRESESGAPPLARTVHDLDDPRFLRARAHADQPEVCAHVTVMKGCDERCSFCIVPYTRGPERYRPADDIVGEIADLVAGGVREVMLLGQTVNSWYDPTSRSLSFGTGGVDDAEDGETILHELGHALQDAICPDFGQSNEAAAMGEGFGDYFAASFFADKKRPPYLARVMS